MGTLATQQPQEVQRSAQLSQNAEQFINWLFDELAGTFPAWRSAFESQEAITTAKRIWLETISENKLKRSEIKTGLRQARKSTKPFLPSVGQFVEWCRVIEFEVLGLPDVETLLKRLNRFAAFGFSEIHAFKFKSDAEYWLLTDLYERCKRYSWSVETTRSQAEKALLKMAKLIQAGQVIPMPAILLPEKADSYVPPPEVMAQRMAELKARLGVRE